MTSDKQHARRRPSAPPPRPQSHPPEKKPTNAGAFVPDKRQLSQSKADPQTKQQYQALVEAVSPNSRMAQGLFRAFWVGGVICMLGQGLIDVGHLWLDLSATQASTFASIVLIFLTALFTGIGWFDKLGQYAGGGTFVPITGFANAMVSPALEFRREGLVLGLGAKLFSIAGPVLVYGVSSAMVAGLLYLIFGLV